MYFSQRKLHSRIMCAVSNLRNPCGYHAEHLVSVKHTLGIVAQDDQYDDT